MPCASSTSSPCPRPSGAHLQLLSRRGPAPGHVRLCVVTGSQRALLSVPLVLAAVVDGVVLLPPRDRALQRNLLVANPFLLFIINSSMMVRRMQSLMTPLCNSEKHLGSSEWDHLQ